MVRKHFKARALAALISAVAVAGGLVAMVGVASADNVQNDVVAGGNDTITAGGSTTVNYRIAANSGDGQAGCNAEDATPATVNINAPAGVSATPSSLNFNSCGTDQAVSFSSSTLGDHEITVTVADTGTGTYNVIPAKFTLHVVAPPPLEDTTKPSIDLTTPPNGAVYTLNEVVNAAYSCDDNVAIDTCAGNVPSGSAIDTSTAGAHSFTVNASDTSGNTEQVTHTYNVQYAFTGFFSPVDLFITNTVKGGSTVPVKWSLQDAGGAYVSSLSSVSSIKVQAVSCTSVSPLSDAIEATVTGGTSLRYDSTSNQFVYNWQTPKSPGSCFQLQLTLNDVTTKAANFKLK